jgi:hypothetical protein
MPLNGRSWQDLATLIPGVNAIETQIPFENGAIRGNRGFGNQLTISGGRPTQNNYRLDGNSITDYAMGGPGSVLGVNLGVDAIQEFAVITGNYSAEYGRTSGGIVNAVSKSGTNGLHGDVYEFFRNQVLDANDFTQIMPAWGNCFTGATNSALRAEAGSKRTGPSSSPITKEYARRRDLPAQTQPFCLMRRARVTLPMARSYKSTRPFRNTWQSSLTPTARSAGTKANSSLRRHR